tara:strand:- start:31 stop:252 length:222 start_codon:yes stop_codon:yes gene_type:complete
MDDEMTEKENNNDIVIYKSNDGVVSFDVNVFDESVWLTQAQMGELFQRSTSTINEHIKNIYSEKELDESLTMR